jgi:hypothetical protein
MICRTNKSAIYREKRNVISSDGFPEPGEKKEKLIKLIQSELRKTKFNPDYVKLCFFTEFTSGNKAQIHEIPVKEGNFVGHLDLILFVCFFNKT